ncbi:hypothetical protein Tco_0747083 [Tanacetum coccineum]
MDLTTVKPATENPSVAARKFVVDMGFYSFSALFCYKPEVVTPRHSLVGTSLPLLYHWKINLAGKGDVAVAVSPDTLMLSSPSHCTPRIFCL